MVGFVLEVFVPQRCENEVLLAYVGVVYGDLGIYVRRRGWLFWLLLFLSGLACAAADFFFQGAHSFPDFVVARVS